MKRNRIFSMVLVLIVLSIGSVHAQMTAEFELSMTLMSTSFTHVTSFGYDPNATDGNDYPNFGESDYPGDLGGGFPDFYMVNNLFPSGATPVDIHHKPDTASFSIQYEWNMIPKEYPSTISWDATKIPAIIKHIYLVPKADPSRILRDMKTVSSITIPNQDTLLFYQNCYIILLYNEETNAVRSQLMTPSLLSSLAAYPNPYSDRSQLNFTLSQAAYLNLTIYDETGRLIESRNTKGSLGSNTLSLHGLGDIHGALYLRLQATTAGKTEVRTLMLMGR